MAIEIKAADVMKLRKMTGAGMMDCKKALIEAVGAFSAGKIDEAQLHVCEKNTCPTCGSCSGMYTANYIKDSSD